MKTYTLLFLSFFTYLLGFGESGAQQLGNSLTGVVVNEEGEPLPFTNVALKDNATQQLITGVVTDLEGYFMLINGYTGEAFLEISSIGYTPFLLSGLRLDGATKKDLGFINMAAGLESLTEVTVSGMRAQIVFDADKTVVNVEGSPLAEGNTALDVIGRSPGVFVDSDGNINLNGRSGVVVLIDDRPTYMSAQDLANFLRAMPADNVKSIEVINNPSSKYDAEGAAGVINLRLKKNDLSGINGSVHMGHRYNGIHAPNAGASLNVKQGKWTTNANLNYSEWAQFNDLEILRRFQLEEGSSDFDQQARLKLVRKNLFFQGGTTYLLKENHRLGANLQLSRQDGAEDGLSNTAITTPGSLFPTNLRAINDSRSDNTRLFANLHYVGELDTVGTKITSDVDHTFMDAGSLSLLSNRYWTEANQVGNQDRILTGNEMAYSIFTTKVDFTRPLKNSRSVELGLKGSWVKSDNDLQISKSIEEGPLEPDANSNRFVYDENVLAAYGNYHTKLGPKMKLQGGLRLEYSDITGHSVTLDQRNRQQYADLFPSVSLQQTINDNYQVAYNLNRRITRPNYRLLNPFVFYIDPLTVEEGNPNLTPQYATNLEMNHTIKGQYQISLGYARTENAFGQIMIQDDATRRTSIQIQNLDVTQNLNLRFVVPMEVAPWYTMNHMLQLSQNTFQSQLGSELLDESQFTMTFRTQHNMTFGKGWKAEMVGMYMSKNRFGQMVLNPVAWVDAGVSKSFKGDKWNLSVNGSDLLRSQRFTGNIRFDQINTDVAQYNNIQSVRIGLRWKFSQGQNFKVSQRSGSTEEQNRLD
ncbi:TonB-dependent receptor [Lunatimonas lonarensis]|uniref:TonB-dependent receptor n=1 Tax=Lunatimonas lonarensis TaxID=1232681 RepID=R7ZPA6_9BACT|nr:outer membrane beta-barrel protein [Lunatimonas lonarensis]EON75893.1 TonB-dependent receptor [Lunatimonas lonarensis]